MVTRILFYYQTFDNGFSIDPSTITDIHLSSIHFGIETDGQPYIHLNNMYPDNSQFNQVWADMENISKQGINISLMIGGAGGGFATLFQYYTECYSMLKLLLNKHSFINGIDLDIEEQVALNDIVQLMSDLKHDFPDLIVSMSPLQSSLQYDNPGMGGFVYKDILKTGLVDYFCGQFYSDFSLAAFDQCIQNEYSSNQIVMGSINGSGSATVLAQVKQKYPDFGGVDSWEYGTMTNPQQWANQMYAIFTAMCN